MQIVCCHKLIKATIKSHSLRWLKCDEEDSESQPKEFWKTNSSSIQLAVVGNDLVGPCEVANKLR